MEEPTAETIVRTWLTEMERCVRNEAFNECRAIFAPDVVAFGSLGERLIGLDTLERDQWRRVWPRIRDFTFDLTALNSGGGDATLWLACPWSSQGARDDGTPFTRPGRITAVLERRAGVWLAVHTHHSLGG